MATNPTKSRRYPLLGLVAAAVTLLTPAVFAQEKPDAEQILGTLVVPANPGSGLVLPKIAVHPSLAASIEDITIYNIARRDLELSGEFEVLPQSATPEGIYLSSQVDVKAWAKQGAESVVKVSGTKLDSGLVQLEGAAYFAETGDTPVFTTRLVVAPAETRLGSHRIMDALLGALTGTPGGFASQMTFIFGAGKSRRVYVMDSDGHDPRAVSAPEQVALSPAFGPDQKLYYAASINHDEYKVLSPGRAEPLELSYPGSVYGIAFAPDRSRVAVAIADLDSINLYAGPDFSLLKRISSNPMTLHPTFSPSGQIAYSGADRWGQRIFVDNRPVSPAGISASAPVFCRHPNGVRLIYAVGVGKDTDLVASHPNGSGLMRLTQGQGRNGYPACSPDGRLIAFFSTRRSGPGLYIMRIDGTRPQRVSTLVGDSLRWARYPDAEPPPNQPPPASEETAQAGPVIATTEQAEADD